MAVAAVSERGGGAAVGDVVRVRVRALASSGAGVAGLPDGRVAFVHRTAPGDLADVRVDRVRKRWADGTLVDLVEPGPERVPPPCPRFDECGGCALQHLDYDAQLAWKGRFVADAMRRIGGIEVAPPSVEGSPSATRYRNRVTFTLRRLRGGRPVAGFHAWRDPDRIVPVGSECLLPEPSLAEAWAALRAAWRSAAALPEGRELRLTLRSVAGGVLLLVQGGRMGWDASELFSRVDELSAVWHRPVGRRDAVRVAGDALEERWGEERVPVGGRAFLQANRSAAESLVAHVLGRAGEGKVAVDAYCGVGVYGRALARGGWRARGIEWNREACVGARHAAPEGFVVVEGPVEEQLEAQLPADLVVLNPPRTGVHESVPGILARSRPRRVIYVSCDPATLARDAGRMRAAYTLVSLHAFDLFPQTSHVESVAVFDTER